MTETTILPPHLIYLGEAMAPVSRRLSAALAEPLLPTPPAESTASVVEAELAAFNRLISSLSDQMNGPITDVAANESARECDVYRKPAPAGHFRAGAREPAWIKGLRACLQSR